MPRLIRICIFTLICAWSLSVQADEQVKTVGVITTLSGGMATIGKAIKNGVELARTEHPKLFQNLTFIYEDDQFDAKQGISAYRKLIANNRASIIFGFGGYLAHAIGLSVERDKVPFINFNFEAAPAVGKKFIVRSTNHTDQYMLLLAQYLRNSNTAEFPIIQTESTFLSSMIKSLENALGAETRLLSIATVSPNETDFRTIITKLRKHSGKKIGLFLWPEQLIAFTRQAREFGFSAEYFGTDLCETAAVLPTGAVLMEGCVYPDNEVSSAFRESYRSRFGDEAQLTFAGSAYDMAVLIGTLQNKGKLQEPLIFMKSLREVKDHFGVLGKYSFRDELAAGQFFQYEVRIKRITNGRGVPVE
jgi:branched-chain amino acid transport system substrate-binding protein